MTRYPISAILAFLKGQPESPVDISTQRRRHLRSLVMYDKSDATWVDKGAWWLGLFMLIFLGTAFCIFYCNNVCIVKQADLDRLRAEGRQEAQANRDIENDGDEDDEISDTDDAAASTIQPNGAKKAQFPSSTSATAMATVLAVAQLPTAEARFAFTCPDCERHDARELLIIFCCIVGVVLFCIAFQYALPYLEHFFPEEEEKSKDDGVESGQMNSTATTVVEATEHNKQRKKSPRTASLSRVVPMTTLIALFYLPAAEAREYESDSLWFHVVIYVATLVGLFVFCIPFHKATVSAEQHKRTNTRPPITVATMAAISAWLLPAAEAKDWHFSCQDCYTEEDDREFTIVVLFGASAAVCLVCAMKTCREFEAETNNDNVESEENTDDFSEASSVIESRETDPEVAIAYPSELFA